MSNETTPVGWHRHPNGGGLVQDTAHVADTAFVGSDAKVYGSARIYGRARVYGSARVTGNARVYGSAKLCGDVKLWHAARSCDPRVADTEALGADETLEPKS